MAAQATSIPRRALLVVFLALLLLTTAAANGTGILGLVHLQPCPALLLVPFEAFEVRKLELVISLTNVSVTWHRDQEY
jgi:hypothetical protein